jgi:hypothetical protein
MLIYPNGFKIKIIDMCKLLNLEVRLCDACVKSCDLTIIAGDQTQSLDMAMGKHFYIYFEFL